MARKVRDAWLGRWQGYQILRRFSPEARAERQVLADMFAKIRGGESAGEAEPPPLTRLEARALRKRPPRHNQATLSRAFRRLPKDEREAWWLEVCLAKAAARRHAENPWDGLGMAGGLGYLLSHVTEAGRAGT